MTSPVEDGKPQVEIPKSDWPIAGGRCHPDDLYLIDRAALEVRENRSEFVITAALDRARTVLASRTTVESPKPDAAA